MITLYGIPNCDTVKKARKWLDARGQSYRFHDWRKDGSDPTLLLEACQTLGRDAVLNRRGTTWRQLPEAEQNIQNDEEAVALMQRHPAIIKRPLLQKEGELLLGFNEKTYEKLLENGVRT